jgi:hypothetical protein
LDRSRWTRAHIEGDHESALERLSELPDNLSASEFVRDVVNQAATEILSPEPVGSA